MRIKLAKEFCTSEGLVYVYSIGFEGVLYFCALNTENSTYTFYTQVDGVTSIYENSLSLAKAKFKKQLLLEMGGVLGENEE